MFVANYVFTKQRCTQRKLKNSRKNLSFNFVSLDKVISIYDQFGSLLQSTVNMKAMLLQTFYLSCTFMFLNATFDGIHCDYYGLICMMTNDDYAIHYNNIFCDI
ncbi:hypothetical protein ABZP36_013129 [Zizania latifolia]